MEVEKKITIRIAGIATMFAIAAGGGTATLAGGQAVKEVRALENRMAAIEIAEAVLEVKMTNANKKLDEIKLDVKDIDGKLDRILLNQMNGD